MTDTTTIAIDPGPTRSAYVLFRNDKLVAFGKVPNDELAERLRACAADYTVDCVYCEFPHARHQLASNDLFEAACWAGVFSTCCNGVPFVKVNRAAVLLWFKVHKRNVKDKRLGTKVPCADSQIRTAIINMYGGVDVAIGGTKCTVCNGKGTVGRGLPKVVCSTCAGRGLKNPVGPLHGVTSDCWQALAVHLYAEDATLAEGAM